VFVESIVGHVLYYDICKNVLSSQTILISESEERFQTTETDSQLLAGTERLISAVGQESRRCCFSQNNNGLGSSV